MISSELQVTTALEDAVEELGRRLADHPQRLRAVLLDTLGQDAHEHRAEVDAVVLAAEEEVPALLARRRRGEQGPSDAELVERLLARGAEQGPATAAVAAWGRALRTGGATTSAGTTATSPGSGSGALSETTGTAPPSSSASRPSPSPSPSEAPGPPADRAAAPAGVVLTWRMLACLVVAMIVVAGVVGYLAGQGASSPADAAMSPAQMSGATASRSPATPSPSSHASSPSASPSTVASSPSAAAPVPLTAAESMQPDYTPVLVDPAAKRWQVQPLAIQSTGTFDRIEVVQVVEKHGRVNAGADGFVNGTTLTYQPLHNGDFYDHIVIKLHNTATNEVSAPVTIMVHFLCDTTHPCVHMAPGQVMTG